MKTTHRIKTLSPFAIGIASALLGLALVESARAQNNITWGVAGDGVWDTTTANWTGEASTYADGDNVSFDNAAGGTITVLGRTPGSTVVNSTGDYIFETGVSGSGDASILGGTLTKNNSGTLSLGDADLNAGNVYSNSFSSVAINGGTLRYGNKDALGSGIVTLAGGTTLIKFGQEGNASGVGLPNDLVLNGNVSMFLNFGSTKDQYFNGTVSGPGSITVTGSSRSVTMDGPNTYSGGSVVDGGTLRGGFQNNDSFGTGAVTLNNGTVLVNRGNHANTLIANGGKLYGDNGFNDSTWSGPITLNTDLTVQPQWNLTLSGVISGPGGLIIKRDFNARTVILTGVNTYAGDTTVEDSTLRVTGTSIPDSGKLIIDGGKVEPIGTETVNNLFFGSAIQAIGTYGATGSGADNIDDTRFTGSAGVINVLVGTPQDEADILFFGQAGTPATISGANIAWAVPPGTDVTTLAPDFETSFGAVATPPSGTTRDFTTPQDYSLDSGDGTITGNIYTVTVTVGPVPTTFTWDSGASGDWSDPSNWTNDLASGEAPGGYGGSAYVLNFAAPAPYTATHDLFDGFEANQLNFSASATLDSESKVVLAADGGSLPQINQNSGSVAFIDLPVELAADTTFGGTGGGLVEMKNQPISGTGSLTMDGLGTLTLRDPNNLSTYSGGTIINSGTLRVDYRGNDDFPTDTVFGAGPVTLNGGTLFLFRVTPTNTLVVNGGGITSENGFGNNWNGPITLNADMVVNCQFILRANGDISGTGGVVKNGNDRLWLNGTNTYTGDTTVNAGTLRTTGSSIIDTGKLVIDGGKVEPVGSETVGSLFFGAVEQGPGTYGSTSSAATTQDDSRFSGTGVIVVPAASTPFETWAGGTGPGLGFDEDFNSDGVDNGIAFLLGAAGPGVDANDRLPTVSEDGSGNLVMQFDCLPSAARGTAELRVAHSNALASWTATVDEVPDVDDAVADNDVTFVVGVGPVGPPALNSVTATIDGSAAAGGKLFGRLQATE